MPLGVGVRGLVEDDEDEGLHVDDGCGLRPESLVSLLVLIKGGGAESSLLGLALGISTGGSVVVVGRHQLRT
jgi:hypothetical protein